MCPWQTYPPSSLLAAAARAWARDKACCRSGEQTLLQRVLRTASAGGRHGQDRSAPRARYAQFGDVIEDIYPGCGPLGGIHAALSATSTRSEPDALGRHAADDSGSSLLASAAARARARVDHRSGRGWRPAAAVRGLSPQVLGAVSRRCKRPELQDWRLFRRFRRAVHYGRRRS